ncbi:MAG TPA: hypothetical protein VFB62_10915 [Polyangiaceae bacterium]|nr:hypothetical protein [Polyangiaceae bacterium]
MRGAALVSIALVGCNAVSGLSDFQILEGTGGAQSATSTTSTGGAVGVGGSGGSAGNPNCPFDDFEDGTIDPTKWSIEVVTGAYFTESGGVLTLDVVTSLDLPRYTRMLYVQPVSLETCGMTLQVLQNSIGDEFGEEFYFSAILDAQNSVGFMVRDNYLSAGKLEGGVLTVKSVSYAPQAYGWWRFRAQDATVSFQTSPDGMTWTEFDLETVNFPLTTLTLAIAGGVPGTSMATGGRATIDNFNTH